MRLSLILLLFLSSCLLDVNTSDPLASISILASKKNGVFVKEYLLSTASHCTPKEAWIEYGWKKEIKDDTIIKKKFNEYQLVLNMDLSPMGLRQSNYFINWKLVEDTFGTLGTANGVYVLRLKNKEMPPVFTIHIYQNDSVYKDCEIILKS